MTRIDENYWPARQPSAGFADATVERMLRAHPASMAKARGRTRWLGLALAAIFATGAAYGWVRTVRPKAPPRQDAKPLQLRPALDMQQRLPRVVLPSTLELPAPAVPVLPRATPPAPRASAIPEAPAATAPLSSPKVPACQCERGFSDFICDCY